MEEKLILVDEKDNEIGIEEKIKAHLNGGKLHRAFSIFIFNDKEEMLLQKRAKTKYHCPGLWTNACCSHPRPGEKTEKACHRRLKEEMGFDCKLKEIFSFIYKTKFDNGLTEWEFDHVFRGVFNGFLRLNLEEAEDYKWIKIKELKEEIKKNPEFFTPWFKIAISRLE